MDKEKQFEKKPRLLMMASLFFPQKNSGGPPVSIQNLIDELKSEYEIVAISKNHEIGQSRALSGVQSGWNDMPFGRAYYVPYGQHTLRNILALIDEVTPDIIYQNSFFSYDDLLPVLVYHRKHPWVRLIITPRGEFQERSYRNGHLKKFLYCQGLKMLGLLKNVDWQVADKTEAGTLSRVLNVPVDEIFVIPNISKGGCIDKTRVKQKGILKIIYTGRIHQYKNLKYALEVISRLKGRIQFDIYGAIEDKQYFAECRALMDNMPEGISCACHGVHTNEQIRQLIGKYHVLFAPSQSEAYGQSIAEALLVDVPVVISDQTPWSDVAQYNAGYAIELDRQQLFVSRLQEFVDMDNERFSTIANNAGRYIRVKQNCQSCVEQYKDMFSIERLH